MENENKLALRILGGLEKLVLENSALKAFLREYHPESPWESHVAMMQADPEANAVVREKFSALHGQLEAADDLSAALQSLLRVFPANNDWN
jgi:hypothetical protein